MKKTKRCNLKTENGFLLPNLISWFFCFIEQKIVNENSCQINFISKSQKLFFRTALKNGYQP